jgi:hypothetical protein
LKRISNGTEDIELPKLRGVSIIAIWTLVLIEGRMWEVIVEEHCIICSIRQDLGNQVCIDKHAPNLFHHAHSESLSQGI